PPLRGQTDDVSTWYLGLCACPLDASLLDKVRAVYRTGLDHFQAKRTVENGWRKRAAYHRAYDDGLNGRPLSVDLAHYDSQGWELNHDACGSDGDDGL